MDEFNGNNICIYKTYFKSNLESTSDKSVIGTSLDDLVEGLEQMSRVAVNI